MCLCKYFQAIQSCVETCAFPWKISLICMYGPCVFTWRCLMILYFLIIWIAALINETKIVRIILCTFSAAGTWLYWLFLRGNQTERKTCACLLVNFPYICNSLRLGWGQWLELGTQSRFPMWEEHDGLGCESRLLPEVWVSREMETGARGVHFNDVRCQVSWPAL